MRHYCYCLLMSLMVLLLASCQSNRPVFYFGSRPVQAHRVPAATDSAAAAEQLVFAETARPAVIPPASLLPAHAQPRAATPVLKQPARYFAAQQRRWTAPRSSGFRPVAARSAYASRPLFQKASAARSNDLFFLGGLLLLGVGLTAGLLIGGWLGLLVGLAPGIPGYLLLGRGYAGSWKSVARHRPTVASPLGQLQQGRVFVIKQFQRPADNWNTLGLFILLIGSGLLVLLVGLIAGSLALALIGVGISLVSFLLFLIISGNI